MEGNTRNIRLFKVAKELNVSTSMLVEHLGAKGFSLEDSPNTKLDGAQYNLLLKEFASDQMIKKQAEQLSEKRREDFKTGTAKSTEENTSTSEDAEPEKDILSAEQIRDRITPGGPIVRKRIPPVEKPAEAAPAIPPKEIPVAKQETPDAPLVEEKPKVVTPPEPPTGSVLKIVGRIDLDSLKPGAKKPQAEAPKQPAKPVEPAKKPVFTPAPTAQKPEAPKPAEKQPEPPKPEVSPVAQESKAAQKEPTQDKPEPPKKDKEDDSVITVGSNTPQLSGLKVMGKIELPSSGRGKKDNSKSAATPAANSNNAGGANNSTNAADKDDDSDAANKKRRRRRRKRKGPAGTTPGTEGGAADKATPAKPPLVARPNLKPGKKEKPTQKEVDQSIRDTLSQIGKGASKSRQRLRRAKRDSDAARRDQDAAMAEAEGRILSVTEFITANEFANLLEVHVNDIIRKSFELGMMVSINQRLDAELMTIIAEEYGYIINFVDVTDDEFEIEEEEDDPADLEIRTPIVTVMGHVDHGKTTLLDRLRKANVAAGEAGGITQHIGAYEVKLEDDKYITFLDTPGHEAFTAMRARGAKVTDVAIIVISADDAVMPQTREAINHAEAAGVKMVFAINKIDKAGADPERIKGQLAEMNYLVEDWGGKYQSQEISALKGQGVDDLLEKVILEAELLELKANENRTASGTVIEARLDKGRGNVATVLVQNGTLRVGDDVVAGIHYGKVRAMIDQNGNRVKEAGPAKPVQLLGLGGSPQAGDKFHVFEEDGRAKSLAQRRQELYREQQFRQTKRITLEEIGRRRAIGNFRELNVIIRGDVDGSVEALSGSLMKLSTEEVQVNIIAKGNGAITEADVNLAIASDAVVIAFNVRPNALARSLAEREEVDIRTYSVIYNAINDVRDALEGLLSPEIKEEEMGTAEVLEVFRITKVGLVAGGMVKTGKIKRDDPVRVIRDGIVLHESKLGSLKRFKDDAKEVFGGQEFGFTIDSFPDLQKGDTIESYTVKEIRRKL
ncbi:MAG: translation initiation factor IF-2 [Bacteroidia bacterium]|nr:translation initiation factor IF-2 [Bacteroidia bacterium]